VKSRCHLCRRESGDLVERNGLSWCRPPYDECNEAARRRLLPSEDAVLAARLAARHEDITGGWYR